MGNDFWVIIFTIDIFIAYLIAKYQHANGYTFYKTFVGALIGIVGLTILGVKAWMDF